MKHATFVYTIYIRADADAVWRGLLEPEFTRHYWMHEHESDWEVGSPWTHRAIDGGPIRIVGEVLESDRPNKLALSWTPPDKVDDPTETSKVTFEIAPQNAWPNGPWVALTVTHAELIEGSDMHTSVSWGWPALASGLKTLLETGA